MKFLYVYIATMAASQAKAVSIQHGGRAIAATGGGVGCIPVCYVYASGHRGCQGRAEFVGHCNDIRGDIAREVDGCDGVNVRWISNDGNGVDIWQVRDANGWDEFNVTECDVPHPTTNRCTYDGGCSATQV